MGIYRWREEFSDHVGECAAHLCSMRAVGEYFCPQKLENGIAHEGYMKRPLLSSSQRNRRTAFSYYKDPQCFISNKIKHTPCSALLMEPFMASACSQNMNYGTGNEFYRAAELNLKGCKYSQVGWNHMQLDGEQSLNSGFQCYSDQFQTSFSAGAIKFYRLHVVLVNCTEKMRRDQVIQHQTIPAHIPVR